MEKCQLKFYYFIPFIFASAGFLLSLVGNVWCETISFDGNVDNNDVSLKFGVFKQQCFYVDQTQANAYYVKQTCCDYPSYVSYDTKWTTTKAFAVIAPVIGGFLCFFTFLAPCLYFPQSYWKCGSYTYLFVCLFQGITLIFINSNACTNNPVINSLEQQQQQQKEDNTQLFDSQCKMDVGYICNIVSVVCWFISGMFGIIMKGPTPPERPPPETQTVTYTQTPQPDGTVLVTEDVVKGTYVPGSSNSGGGGEAVEGK